MDFLRVEGIFLKVVVEQGRRDEAVEVGVRGGVWDAVIVGR